jgi:2-phosphosulfolactate phosphatase
LAQELRNTLGGRNLLAIGHDHDLATCAEIDRFTIVPRYDPTVGRIFLP